jgi:hypothetical protein
MRNHCKEKNQDNPMQARRMIDEMIEASMELAQKKGPHPLENGCICIVCVNRRKALLKGNEPEWKYSL